ncbi:TauD/TfdA family dioxygenase [Amycolatopsis sp. PS_44_ISF1]|uniref:TauD/TfdA family dioxygenase n=1 Tax=Amycolatopsis sp. PS_44_ISF1 TaxID=2974917 RepID=UPI0028DE5BB1|nr:TauD/TfdA family dioxygenase [Amycolatopsis sp. PS_44_ISF1]MDT8913886.1 TauD/TfdA family dioxygenase [Amycolatopsis sp. PS_44_ISF1]
MTLQLDGREQAAGVPMSHTLSEADRSAVRELAAELADPGGRIDDPGWPELAREASSRLPAALIAAIQRFRRDPGREGVLCIRGLPVDENTLPPSPTVAGSVQHEPAVPSSALVLASMQLGEVVAFRQEKGGALVQNVVPVPGEEDFQGNAGSVRLKMHTENAFHRNSPDYVLLLCLRNDHDNVAGLLTSSVRCAAELLSADVREVLGQPRFVTAAPGSFQGAPTPSPRPVLEGAPDDPDIRVDFAATDPLDVTAANALEQLQRAIEEVRRTFVLSPGDLAVVDNRIALHGRTSFRPRYDGQDRWLQRTYVQLDGRRSRPARRNNGNVLD